MKKYVVDKLTLSEDHADWNYAGSLEEMDHQFYITLIGLFVVFFICWIAALWVHEHKQGTPQDRRTGHDRRRGNEVD